MSDVTWDLGNNIAVVNRSAVFPLCAFTESDFLSFFFKSDFFTDNEAATNSKSDDDDNQTVSELDAVKETLLKDAVSLRIAEESVGQGCQQSCQPPKKVKKTLGSVTSMRKLMQTPSAAQSPRDRVTKEIDRYLQFQTIDGDDDPLEWWKAHVREFPLLSQLARRYLATPASSAPTERLFSKAGQVVSSKRVLLKPNKANMLVFLAENL